MNISEIENVLYSWINGLLGHQVIFAYQGNIRPQNEYTLINIIFQKAIGYWDTKEERQTDGTIKRDYSNLQLVTISINTFRENAFQRAIDIKKSLMVETVSDLIWTGGLGYVSTTQIQKIPEEINKDFEERGQFDIVFHLRDLETEIITDIQKIEINNKTIGA